MNTLFLAFGFIILYPSTDAQLSQLVRNARLNILPPRPSRLQILEPELLATRVRNLQQATTKVRDESVVLDRARQDEMIETDLLRKRPKNQRVIKTRPHGRKAPIKIATTTTSTTTTPSPPPIFSASSSLTTQPSYHVPTDAEVVAYYIHALDSDLFRRVRDSPVIVEHLMEHLLHVRYDSVEWVRFAIRILERNTHVDFSWNGHTLYIYPRPFRPLEVILELNYNEYARVLAGDRRVNFVRSFSAPALLPRNEVICATFNTTAHVFDNTPSPDSSLSSFASLSESDLNSNN